ncbi:ubiquitin-conjugating enzyme domain-containing protein [Ditylenchus destructor]|uniref:Ubiquitin-conjugating enzyme domain-containing protein n=1 Tax=Ditylenchus destructor TaxID=166010 RepID=A0AAD4NBS0_9BILA|nr:ubiquitin-conjugating enzyme domain-containing protein [Ditylenchus destructor]
MIPKLELSEKEPEGQIREEASSSGMQDESSSKPGPLRVRPEQRRMHYISQEYMVVAKDPIEGIYVTISEKDPLLWFGLLIVRAGIFCGGLFRFTLQLPSDFPDTTQVPVVKFEDPLFHPLINPKTNIVDMTRFFPSGWQRDRNHIYQVLTATQSMFFRCRVEVGHAANPEAAILLSENSMKFRQMARDAVRRSRTQIYDIPNTDDANTISFTPWNESEMEPVREFLIGKKLLSKPPYDSLGESNSTNGKKAGFSWVDPERCRYMCDILPPKNSPSGDFKSPTSTPKDEPATSSSWTLEKDQHKNENM